MGSLIADLSERLKVSLWWIPASMVLVALALGIWLPEVDRGLGSREIVPQWLRTGSPEGARQVLGTLAAATITVAGVIFSITVVGLTLASQQFGPRLLRSFMTDRASQVIMGTFAGVHVYSLIVLRSIRGTDEITFVPDVSAAVALVFALAAIGALIWFFHHFAASIVVERVLEHVGDELIETARRIPNGGGDEAAAPGIDPFAGATFLIRSRHQGYILAADTARLLEVANEQRLTIDLLAMPGRFISEGMPLLRIAGGPEDDDLERSLLSCFVFGTTRTPTQDISFAIAQLAEVAVRALSPSLNDPNTAIGTLDRIGAGLIARGMERDPAAWRKAGDGEPRLLTHPVSWNEIVDEAFLPILHFGVSIPIVALHVMEVVERLVSALPAHRHPPLLATAMIARDRCLEGNPFEPYRTKLLTASDAVARAAAVQPPGVSR